jgi:hypothetical protein
MKVLVEGRSDRFKQHFLGMHFFNPPRYLHLLELIPRADTLPDVLDADARASVKSCSGRASSSRATYQASSPTGSACTELSRR